MKDKRIRHQISFKLNPETDQDIIEHLAGISNIQGYLKGMIRGQIAYQAYHKNWRGRNGSANHYRKNKIHTFADREHEREEC